MSETAIVVTTINSPNQALKVIRDAARTMGAEYILIGDTKSPSDFHLEGGAFYSFESQKNLGFRFAELCPARHYARKNIGYLLAARDGADIIVETDDDNIPKDGFHAPRVREVTGDLVLNRGWVNVYTYFIDSPIWPRGLPLDEIHRAPPSPLGVAGAFCPIQQGLADGNPDVDAIYRLVLPLPRSFVKRAPVILGKGVWCPFNSQNTTFFREAFPLMYLPYHCSFRMTDIWRSFVAQRLLWECDWRLSFHEASVYQERNEHDLLRDFEDEVPGYLFNRKIQTTLEDLSLKSGEYNLADNVRTCYSALIKLGCIGAEEELLLDSWLEDMMCLAR